MCILLAILLGTLFGSVTTVVVYRIPNSIALIKNRSFCPNCNKKIKFADVIPIFSYLRLGGKCRNCNSKISKRYLIIEIISPLIFVLLYLIYGISFELLLNLTLWSMLLIVFIIDLEYMVVSDAVLILFSLPVFIYIALTNASWLDHLFGLGVGFVSFFLIYLITRLIYKKEAFGFGDVMLSGVVGWFLGLEKVILTGILSFLIAFGVIVFLRLIGKDVRKEMEIPFGPFICIAAIVSSLFGEEIISLYLGRG